VVEFGDSTNAKPKNLNTSFGPNSSTALFCKQPHKKRKNEPELMNVEESFESECYVPDYVESKATYMHLQDYDPRTTCPATYISNNIAVARCVVLLMALQRSEPSQLLVEGCNRGLGLLPSVARKPEFDENGCEIIPDGFFWRDYPVLEQVLIDAMPDFYGNANSLPQSSVQKMFNNRLVIKMRKVAHDSKYVFGSSFITDSKKLRDRIRCYYKTHQQNAKKRLCTLLKKPEKKEHVDALRYILHCVHMGKFLDDGRNPDLPFKLRRIGTSQGGAMLLTDDCLPLDLDSNTFPLENSI
jgi:hypothetical protein